MIAYRQLLGHPDETLTSCSISVDSQFVIAGSAKGTIYSWDVARSVGVCARVCLCVLPQGLSCQHPAPPAA